MISHKSQLYNITVQRWLPLAWARTSQSQCPPHHKITPAQPQDGLRSVFYKILQIKSSIYTCLTHTLLLCSGNLRC